MKPIPVSEFCNHVELMHADRDKLFEKEYTVSHPLNAQNMSELKMTEQKYVLFMEKCIYRSK